jgi:hypothetical protein
VGTGGTLCGTGKFLKEKNPNREGLGHRHLRLGLQEVKETGVFDKNEIYPYITEGIGEDFVPGTWTWTSSTLRKGDRSRCGDHDRRDREGGGHLRGQLARAAAIGGPEAAEAPGSRRARSW